MLFSAGESLSKSSKTAQQKKSAWWPGTASLKGQSDQPI
jgi:hypothetical protein